MPSSEWSSRMVGKTELPKSAAVFILDKFCSKIYMGQYLSIRPILENVQRICIALVLVQYLYYGDRFDSFATSCNVLSM